MNKLKNIFSFFWRRGGSDKWDKLYVRENNTQVFFYYKKNYKIPNCIIMALNTFCYFIWFIKYWKLSAHVLWVDIWPLLPISWVISWLPHCKHLTQIHFPSNHKSGYDLSRFPLWDYHILSALKDWQSVFPRASWMSCPFGPTHFVLLFGLRSFPRGT